MSAFLTHLRENHPDILFDLGDEEAIMRWTNERLEEVSGIIKAMKAKFKPEGKIIAACKEALVQNLLPSRYNYVCNILHKEFKADYQRLLGSGVLRSEALNMVLHCRSTFDDLRFAVENEDNSFTRHAITGMLREYLDGQRMDETLANGFKRRS